MKKVLSAILVLIMLLSMIPFCAWAEEEGEGGEPLTTSLGEPADDPTGEPAGDLGLSLGAPLLGGSPDDCNVSYDANTGSGTVADINSPYAKDSTVTVLDYTGLTPPEGHKFKEWNTESSGTGTRYAPGATFPISANTILYAIWEEISYTVDFDTKGDSDKASQTVKYSDTIDLSYSGTRKGYKSFDGWATIDGGPVIYQVSETPSKLSVNDGATVTLYGVWTPKTLIITFNGMGGKTEHEATSYTQTFNYDETKPLTANQFEKDYYKFVRWDGDDGNSYKNKAQFSPNDLIDKGKDTLLLDAIWEKKTYYITVKFFLYSEKKKDYGHTTKDVGSGYASGFDTIAAAMIKDGTQLQFDVDSFPPEKVFYFTANNGYTLTEIEKTKTGYYPVVSKDGTIMVSEMKDAVGCTIKVYFKASKGGGQVGAALTGDDFDTWMAIAGISLIGAAGTGIMYKKKRRKEE